jgi:NADH-quinone oxidoreductase subunit L
MPVTFATVLIGSLALVGVFPLAGFWSKDEILADAWGERPWVFFIGMAGVYLTAVYVGRMLILTFFGEYRGGQAAEDDADHAGDAHAGGHHGDPHESPSLMTTPLVVLAVLALVAGFANAPFTDHWLGDIIEGWLPEHTEELVTHSDFSYWIAATSVGLGIAGLFTSWLIYQVRVLDPARIRSFLEPLPEILENRYYLDALYQDVIVRIGLLGGLAWLLNLWDRYVIDGAVNGVGRLTAWTADQVKLAQAGQAQLYASVMFLGTIAAVVGILVVSEA